MVTGRPQRYCPVFDRDHLPLGVIRLLADYNLQFAYAKITQNNLCNSCLHTGIACDPVICEPKLEQALRYAQSTNNPLAVYAGGCKRVYRQYSVDQQKDAESISEGWQDLAAGLLDGY